MEIVVTNQQFGERLYKLFALERKTHPLYKGLETDNHVTVIETNFIRIWWFLKVFMSFLYCSILKPFKPRKKQEHTSSREQTLTLLLDETLSETPPRAYRWQKKRSQSHRAALVTAGSRCCCCSAHREKLNPKIGPAIVKAQPNLCLNRNKKGRGKKKILLLNRADVTATKVPLRDAAEYIEVIFLNSAFLCLARTHTHTHDLRRFYATSVSSHFTGQQTLLQLISRDLHLSAAQWRGRSSLSNRLLPCLPFSNSGDPHTHTHAHPSPLHLALSTPARCPAAHPGTGVSHCHSQSRSPKHQHCFKTVHSVLLPHGF